MPSRSLDDLAAPVRVAAVAFLEKAQALGVSVLIYCTLRSNAEQMALYAQGRSKAGPIVTFAPAGRSLHNPDKDGKAWAFDAVPLGADGKALWGDAEALARMGEAGESVGLEWGGRWQSVDAVHFQLNPNSMAVSTANQTANQTDGAESVDSGKKKRGKRNA